MVESLWIESLARCRSLARRVGTDPDLDHGRSNHSSFAFRRFRPHTNSLAMNGAAFFPFEAVGALVLSLHTGVIVADRWPRESVPLS
jgi:hypothetical protein